MALYGCDRLILDKQQQLKSLELDVIDEPVLQQREEISEQIRALTRTQANGDRPTGLTSASPLLPQRKPCSGPILATWARLKNKTAQPCPLGRVSTFLDIYIQQDLDTGRLTETEAQELIDQFVMKLRMVRFLRTPEYNQLFSGDPVWVTESIGGMGLDGRPLVTKTSFRFLQTLNNLGAAPEPNLTVLWSSQLPLAFKQFLRQNLQRHQLYPIRKR